MKAIFFDHMVHFIGEQNMLTFVKIDCGINFYLEKFRRWDR